MTHLNRSTSIIWIIPANSYTIGGCILQMHLWRGRRLHGEDVVVDVILSEQILRLASVIPGQAGLHLVNLQIPLGGHLIKWTESDRTISGDPSRSRRWISNRQTLQRETISHGGFDCLREGSNSGRCSGICRLTYHSRWLPLTNGGGCRHPKLILLILTQASSLVRHWAPILVHSHEMILALTLPSKLFAVHGVMGEHAIALKWLQPGYQN